MSSEAVVTWVLRNLTDPHRSDAWNGGFVVGWMEALIEHGQQTFSGVLPTEHMTVLQQV